MKEINTKNSDKGNTRIESEHYTKTMIATAERNYKDMDREARNFSPKINLKCKLLFR